MKFALKIGSFFFKVIVGFTEKAMAPHSSILAWKIPWVEEPSRLQKVPKSRTQLSDFTFTFIHYVCVYVCVCVLHFLASLDD